MSSAVSNLGTFDPNQYKNNGTGNKPNQRMAGDYLSEFANQNANDEENSTRTYSYQGNNGKSYNTNTEKMLFGNSGDSNNNSNTNSTAPKASAAPQAPKASAAPQASQAPKAPKVSASSPVTYDEDKYRYYESDFGRGTGADAYAKDMEGYNNMVAMNEGDGLAAGHLGLVAQMMHPDWGRSQRAGGGAEAPEAQDYATKPQYAAGSKGAALFDRKFGSGGEASKGQTQKYGGSQVKKFSSNNNNKGWQ